jgi:hypothetical protein
MDLEATGLPSAAHQNGAVDCLVAGRGICVRNRAFPHGGWRANEGYLDGPPQAALFVTGFPGFCFLPWQWFLRDDFRFDRDTWRRSLMTHAAACLLFTLAYEGLSLLASPAPFSLSGGKIRIIPANDAVSLRPVGPVRAGSSASQRPEDSNRVLFDSRSLHVERGPMPTFVSSNVATIRRGEGVSAVTPSADGSGKVRILTFSPRSKWTQFLHSAIMRTQFTIPIYLCIVCLCWVVNYFQESAERERQTLELEARLAQANLRALKTQLQPHFLFNTLNAISSLLHDNPKVADDMIGSLSQFLRTTLDISAENEVPLRTELEFVDRYLEIQQTRFGDRWRVVRDVNSTTLEALVPPLILQPLVENAIRYGIESRETGGTVAIRAAREQGVLRLEISDDGQGFMGGQMQAQQGRSATETKRKQNRNR